MNTRCSLHGNFHALVYAVVGVGVDGAAALPCSGDDALPVYGGDPAVGASSFPSDTPF